MSRPVEGLISTRLFRIVRKVIACLIVRRRSTVCQLNVSTKVVGLVVLLWTFATDLEA